MDASKTLRKGPRTRLAKEMASGGLWHLKGAGKVKYSANRSIGMLFKLGKKVPRHDVRTLKFARYTAALAPPPTQAMWQTCVNSFPMDGNDSVGDCTIAGAAHLMENWSYNEKPPTPVVMSTQDCLTDYYALTGGPDSGLDLLTVLRQWQGAGLAYSGTVDVITAYTALQTGSTMDAQQAVALFGGAYIGLELPDFAVTGDMLSTPWVVPPGGAVGNAAPDPSNGHCVPIVGYDVSQAYVATWGTVIPMGWDFYQAYCDEAYAIIAPDWLGSGTAPSGFDMQQLQADLAQVEA
jgi:hypothetical protein